MASNPLIPPTQQQTINALIPPIPMPPPPMSPSMGFQAWAQDPQNAHKVVPAMTAPTQPLQPNAGAQPPAQMASANPPQVPQFGSAAANPPKPAPMASANPPGVNLSGMNAPTMPAMPPAPAQTAVPGGPASYAQDQAANPGKYAQPYVRGKGTAILNAIVAGLDGAAGGLHGNPGAGVDYAMNVRQHDEGVPGQNQQLYQSSVVAPYQNTINQGTQQRQATADLAHTQAETNQANTKTGLLGPQFQAQAAKSGMKVVTDENGNMGLAPDPDSPIYKAQQQKEETLAAQAQYMQAGSELRNAQAALAASKNDPNSPAYKQAQQRLTVAQQNANAAGQRAQAYWGRYLQSAYNTGLDGNVLAGSMIADNGQVVGTGNASNVRPTGTQRNKGNMAESADQQISDMEGIIAKRPDIFGPAAGRTTQFQTWVGSQDPDAQRFRAARTIAGDHLAGTFGGRSEAALSALDSAIGQFKDNPAAVKAGLDQLREANSLFLKAGTVRTAGSKNQGPMQAGNPMVPPKASGKGAQNDRLGIR